MKPKTASLLPLPETGHPGRQGWLGLLLLFGVFLLLPAFLPVVAAEPAQAVNVDWFRVGMGLFGGLALFLYGMEEMSNGLKAASGDSLKNLLGKLTTNRFSGALTGAFVTAILNSSSVTTVLVVGFITAGVMTLSQSIGIIMGANVGSTFTAQIVAFNVTQYALLPVAIGFAMNFTAKNDRIRYYGMMIMGLGLVFFGMGIMSEAMAPLRSYQPFLDLIQQMENPLLGILVGAVFTGLVQSSAATTGIAIVMASEGLMSLPAGIALALGANIGTCVTALLASIGKPTEARRAAMAHVLFNVFGVLLWVGFIGYLADFVVWFSPSYPELQGTARAAREVPRQIANAHTTFNVFNTLLFIGFTEQFARLVQWLVPEKALRPGVIIEPEYLDDSAISAPSVALENIRHETARMGDIVVTMYHDVRPAVVEHDHLLLGDIRKRYDQVDILNVAILAYMQKVRKEELTDSQSLEFQHLLSVVENLSSIADVIRSDIIQVAEKLVQVNMSPSAVTVEIFRGLFAAVERALQSAIAAIRDKDQSAAQDVLAMKPEIDLLVDKLLVRKAHRMGEEEMDYLETVRAEMATIEVFRHIYTLTKRIARVELPSPVANKD